MERVLPKLFLLNSLELIVCLEFSISHLNYFCSIRALHKLTNTAVLYLQCSSSASQKFKIWCSLTAQGVCRKQQFSLDVQHLRFNLTKWRTGRSICYVPQPSPCEEEGAKSLTTGIQKLSFFQGGRGVETCTRVKGTSLSRIQLKAGETGQLGWQEVFEGNIAGKWAPALGQMNFKSELVKLYQIPVWILLLRSKIDHNFSFSLIHFNSQSVHTILMHFKEQILFQL